MASHPVNLALRFLLELAALFALGFWGWTEYSGARRIILAIALPLVAAILWGTFRVPGDPKEAPVAVPGIVRLAYEFVFFGAATWALYAAGRPKWGLILGVIVVVHYLTSYDRISWLLKQ